MKNNSRNGKPRRAQDCTTESETASLQRARRATGPKTPEGKMRSKYNAVRHGIFTKLSIEGYECEREFKRLREGLREAWQPAGIAEDCKVGELAIQHWKLNRVHVAEKAEIEKNTKFLREDVTRLREAELRKVDTASVAFDGGLLRYAHNPLVLRRCIKLLTDWREIFAEHGFVLECDWNLLAQVYGWEQQKRPTEHLPFAYNFSADLLSRMQWKTEEDAGELETPPGWKEGLLKDIDAEIKELTERWKALQKEDAERLEYEVRTHLVPVNAERYQKYETSIYRLIEKLEIALERMQRRRQGEKDLPPIKVDVSG